MTLTRTAVVDGGALRGGGRGGDEDEDDILRDALSDTLGNLCRFNSRGSLFPTSDSLDS
jgi:hypothetical protein